MQLLNRAFFLITLAASGCSSTVMVEMAVIPATPTIAKIKQVAGDVINENPSSCNMPCAVKLEPDTKFEVSLDALGYYPAVIQYDWIMAFSTTTSWGHSPLIIPLIPRKAVVKP